jgi:hypothetical protein
LGSGKVATIFDKFIAGFRLFDVHFYTASAEPRPGQKVVALGRPRVAKSQAGGVLMLSSPMFGSTLPLLADLALRNRLPAINIFTEFAQRGGLIGYGPDLPSLFTQAGVLTRKLCRVGRLRTCQSNVRRVSNWWRISRRRARWV